jgi:hypothetical protein
VGGAEGEAAASDVVEASDADVVPYAVAAWDAAEAPYVAASSGAAAPRDVEQGAPLDVMAAPYEVVNAASSDAPDWTAPHAAVMAAYAR